MDDNNTTFSDATSSKLSVSDWKPVAHGDSSDSDKFYM
jgi:hypothetical protein